MAPGGMTPQFLSELRRIHGDLSPRSVLLLPDSPKACRLSLATTTCGSAEVRRPGRLSFGSSCDTVGTPSHTMEFTIGTPDSDDFLEVQKIRVKDLWTASNSCTTGKKSTPQEFLLSPTAKNDPSPLSEPCPRWMSFDLTPERENKQSQRWGFKWLVFIAVGLPAAVAAAMYYMDGEERMASRTVFY